MSGTPGFGEVTRAIDGYVKSFSCLQESFTAKKQTQDRRRFQIRSYIETARLASHAHDQYAFSEAIASAHTALSEAMGRVESDFFQSNPLLRSNLDEVAEIGSDMARASGSSRPTRRTSFTCAEGDDAKDQLGEKRA